MRKYLQIIVLSFLLFSCDDDTDLTLPSSVNLSFGLASSTALNGRLEVENLQIQFNRIEIIGQRSAGANVNLERNFADNQGKVNVSNNNSVLNFDIPQGSYQNLNFRLSFMRDLEDEDLLEDIDEWIEDKADGEEEEDLAEDLGEIVEEYLEDVNPPFLFTAILSRNGQRFKLIIPINESFFYNIPVLNADDGREITLLTNATNNFEIVFNPDYWFSITSYEALMNADKGKFEDDDNNDDDFNDSEEGSFIFLHKQINPSLYSLIINRIQESTFIRVE